MPKKPLFIVMKLHDLFLVRAIAQDQTPDNGLAFGRVGVDTAAESYDGWLLRGYAAELLYVALAGHAYGSDPGGADPGRARFARAHLSTLREPGFYMATLVIRHFGEFIRPWLATAKQQHGREIRRDPIYRQRIPL